MRGYVPLAEDDAGVLDLGVPAGARAGGYDGRNASIQARTHHSMCIEQVGPLSMPPWPPLSPCPPWP